MGHNIDLSGAGLSSLELMAVLEATRACAEAQDLQGFADTVVSELPSLVGCEVASYNEMGYGPNPGWGRTNPPDLFGLDGRRLSESYDILALYGADNPLISPAMSAPDDAPHCWSDMRTESEIQSTHLYDLLYRHVGVEDQLAGVLEGKDGFVVGFTVDRSIRGFSERDRVVVDLFRRQLKGVRRLLLEAQRARDLAAAQAYSPTAEGSVWQLYLLGGFQLIGPCGQAHVEGKTAELVKLLALSTGPVVLDQVIEMLWPDADLEVARRRLRGVLHRVPHDPAPVVVRQGEALALSSFVFVDVNAFEASATSALTAARKGLPQAADIGHLALSLYRADALPEDIYADWAAAPRERLRRRRLALLDALADQAEQEGNATGAVALISEAVDADPLDEARQLRLAWLYVSGGRRARALEVHEHARRITAGLGLAPSPQWRSLLSAVAT